MTSVSDIPSFNVRVSFKCDPQDPSVSLAVTELRTLLERFANNTSLDSLINALNVLIEDSRRDPELRSWFEQVDTYIQKV